MNSPEPEIQPCPRLRSPSGGAGSRGQGPARAGGRPPPPRASPPAPGTLLPPGTRPRFLQKHGRKKMEELAAVYKPREEAACGSRSSQQPLGSTWDWATQGGEIRGWSRGAHLHPSTPRFAPAPGTQRALHPWVLPPASAEPRPHPRRERRNRFIPAPAEPKGIQKKTLWTKPTSPGARFRARSQRRSPGDAGVPSKAPRNAGTGLGAETAPPNHPAGGTDQVTVPPRPTTPPHAEMLLSPPPPPALSLPAERENEIRVPPRRPVSGFG